MCGNAGCHELKQGVSYSGLMVCRTKHLFVSLQRMEQLPCCMMQGFASKASGMLQSSGTSSQVSHIFRMQQNNSNLHIFKVHIFFKTHSI